MLPTPYRIFLVSGMSINPGRARRPHSAAVRTQRDAAHNHTASPGPLSGAGHDSDERWPTFQAGADAAPDARLFAEPPRRERRPGGTPARRWDGRERQAASPHSVQEENLSLLSALFQRDGECAGEGRGAWVFQN